MTSIERAIRHGVEAGKLRSFVREHGEEGLGGLLRLADRHDRLATEALGELVGAAHREGAAPVTALTGGSSRR